MEHKIFGDYVLTAIPNAFNKKTSWWLSKRGYTLAMYCFTTSGSERTQILEAKFQIENIQSYYELYEMRCGDKQDKPKKEDPYMIKTNIGMVPIAEYCDMMAMQSGYDDYADMRKHGCRLGDGTDEKLATYLFEKKILAGLESEGFDTSKIELVVQNFIDEEHKHCIWYGGVVATVEYKSHVFWLEAHGDVSVTWFPLPGFDDDEYEYFNKNNSGAYSDSAALKHFINDEHFATLSQSDRLAWQNNNWFEILIEKPDGTKSDFGLDGVCDSEFLDECIEKMILTMDDMLDNIYSKESDTPTTLTLERVTSLLYNALDVLRENDIWEQDIEDSVGITTDELAELGFGEEDEF